MTSPVEMPAANSWGSAQDWSTIISGATQGANSGMQGATASVTSKKEAKEAKRRTLANLLNAALKRRNQMFGMGQEYADEMNDYQAQALQNVARGFVESLQGSTRG